MKVVGVTGGIGSGKSVVCKIFSQLGIPVYNADEAVHQLYDKYPELTEKIRTEFSDEVLDKNGKVSRKKLGEVVFADSKKLSALNKIVHPVVKKDFEKWVESRKGFAYLIKEAAILFESGANENCDKVIAVISSLELRINRVRERDHKSKAETELIVSKQLSDEEIMSRSDFVIYNDEKQLVIPQVLKVHSALTK